MLDPSGPKFGPLPGPVQTFDGNFPRVKLIYRQRVPPARIFHRDQSAMHRFHNFDLATDDPALGVGGGVSRRE
jgi:hypothetical protein